MTRYYGLEERIMSCWNIVEDIKTVREMTDIRKLSEDELQNALLGLETLYQMKFEQLFNSFELMLRSNATK